MLFSLHFSTSGEDQQVSDRSSPANGPGLAKPMLMSSSSNEQQQRYRPLTATNPNVKKRIDAALEKNIETIVTQVRRTTTKASQLAQNDLHLFDSTASINSIKNGHHSRETTPVISNANAKYASCSSREMTPDSINTDSANEDQQQTRRRDDQHYRRFPYYSLSNNVDLTLPSNSPYGQQPWPSTIHPFFHQHPRLYLPYVPPSSATTSTPTNILPSTYPSYDPLCIEHLYGPQGLSTYYNQQQQTYLLPEHSMRQGIPNNSSLFRESQSLSDIFNNSINNNKNVSNHLNPSVTNLSEQQQMVLSHLYLNQINSLPFVTLYENSPLSRPSRSNGDIGENTIINRAQCCSVLIIDI